MSLRSPLLLVPLCVALIALASGALFLAGGAQTNDGTPVPPLDDSYIHLQYGWQAAQGQFWQYNPGDTPTTGGTSLLYLLLLAAGFTLGITREAMPAVSLAFGLILFALTAATMADLGRRAAAALWAHYGRRADREPPPAWAAWSVGGAVGLLFATSGWMAWAFFSGMETGLLVALVAAALWAFLARRARLTALFAALAVLTRPEAWILAVVLLASEWLVRDLAETNDHRRRFAWALVPVGVGLLPFALSLALTGSLSASGLQAKSWLAVVPLYPARVIGAMLETVLTLFVRVLGGPAPDGMNAAGIYAAARWHAFPLAQLLAAWGLVVLWRRGTVPARRLALALLAWIVLGAAATATLQTAVWHHYRYQMPLYPALLPPLGVALAWLLLRGWPARRMTSPTPLRLLLAGIVAAWGVYTMSDFRAAYALDTGTVATQQRVLADWLRAHTPQDAWVAVHDVGAMRYVGERRTFDVVGLTTGGMAAVSHNGPGSIYEALEVFQPDYYAVYPDAAPPYFGLEGAAELLGEELFRVEINPFSVYASASGTQVITRPDWSATALADAPQQPGVLAQVAGWTRVDALDVADLHSEGAHAYTWWHRGEPGGFPTDARRMVYREGGVELTDGGRVLSGGESFTLHTQPGAWLRLVARLHVTADTALRVQVNGEDAGTWLLPALPGEWLESAYLLSPDTVRGEETRITLSLDDSLPGQSYSPFHYWAYQGQPEVLPPAPATVSDAAFAEVVMLHGYDLPGRVYAPGEALTLTLHWEVLNPERAHHRVFVHLIDPQNDTPAGILTQFDAEPRAGTYPFWAWREREAVSDMVTLTVPPDAPPGEYLLLVGVYDADTGVRLPIVGGDDFGADRLILGMITVR